MTSCSGAARDGSSSAQLLRLREWRHRRISATSRHQLRRYWIV